MKQKSKLEPADIEIIKSLGEKHKINLEGFTPYSTGTEVAMTKFGISPTEFHINRFKSFFPEIFCFNHNITHYFFKEKLEIAQIIEFLHEAQKHNSDITLSSTIKGVKKNINLNSSSELNIELWYLANAYLNKIQDGLYQFEFDIPFFDNEDYTFGWNINYPDVFTDDLLHKIIEYEKNVYEKSLKPIKSGLAYKIKRLVHFFRSDNVFDKTKKTIATNEACFLFDTLAYLGIIPETKTENNSDKYEFIKKELRK